MAVQAKASDVMLDMATGQNAPQVAGDLIAGEDLAAGDSVYIKAADGKVWRTNGTAATEPAGFWGLVARNVKTGRAVTIFGLGTRFRYGTGMTPNTKLYVAATAGALDTAPTVGGTVAVARTVNDTDIVIISAGT
jgi:hypothetical protein